MELYARFRLHKRKESLRRYGFFLRFVLGRQYPRLTPQTLLYYKTSKLLLTRRYDNNGTAFTPCTRTLLLVNVR